LDTKITLIIKDKDLNFKKKVNGIFFDEKMTVP
jgi:hypothetical protein